jgi:hypothetical protein
MGFTTSSVYQWVIENIVSQGEEVLHIFQEVELKAWKQESGLGQIKIVISQDSWHMQDSKLVVFVLQA